LILFFTFELDGIDMRREPIETRKATLATIVRKSLPGVRLNEHIAHPKGARCLPSRLQARRGWHRLEGTSPQARWVHGLMCGASTKLLAEIGKGFSEASGHVDGGAIGQRHNGADTEDCHQAPAHVIVPDDGQ
jgi:hypothetical protein